MTTSNLAGGAGGVLIIGGPQPIPWQIGKTYRTKGGWPALVIWVREEPFTNSVVWCIHKPKEPDEVGPIGHTEKGEAFPTVSLNAPPLYGKSQPADLTLQEWDDP